MRFCPLGNTTAVGRWFFLILLLYYHIFWVLSILCRKSIPSRVILSGENTINLCFRSRNPTLGRATATRSDLAGELIGVITRLSVRFFAEKPPQILGASPPKFRLLFPRRKGGRARALPLTRLRNFLKKVS